MKDISYKIRELRRNNGDTLEDLGKKINFNFSNLSKIERGIRKPTIELIEQIMKLYDVPLSYFFGDEGELTPELKEIGVEWVAFIEECEEKRITPEELKVILEIREKYNK